MWVDVCVARSEVQTGFVQMSQFCENKTDTHASAAKCKWCYYDESANEFNAVLSVLKLALPTTKMNGKIHGNNLNF